MKETDPLTLVGHHPPPKNDLGKIQTAVQANHHSPFIHFDKPESEQVLCFLQYHLLLLEDLSPSLREPHLLVSLFFINVLLFRDCCHRKNNVQEIYKTNIVKEYPEQL